MTMSRFMFCGALAVVAAAVAAWPRPAAGQLDYDQAPISYSSTEAADPVAELAARVRAGEATLRYDEARGYLPALLEALRVPVSSQTLVFSKTSLQRQLISPRSPRALYFNDEVYVGYVPDGALLEVAAIDPKLGTVFYTVDQAKRGGERPEIRRQTHECLQCHDSTSLTGGVPGLVMRSVFADVRGQVLFNAGTHKMTDATPWKQRFGGWYVTSLPADGPARAHLGNRTYEDADAATAGPEVPEADLSRCFDHALHLAPTSDAAALMVLTHQAEVHNLLTRARYSALLAIQADDEINRALGRPTGQVSPTNARIRSAGEALVRAMLFCDEAKLPSPLGPAVAGGEFARTFAAAGPKDGRGRSLRDLDLTTRLLKYPCSYLIHSAQFDALPAPMKAYVYGRLDEVVTGKETGKAFAHLSAADRTAIREILLATKKDLPAGWGQD